MSASSVPATRRGSAKCWRTRYGRLLRATGKSAPANWTAGQFVQSDVGWFRTLLAATGCVWLRLLSTPGSPLLQQTLQLAFAWTKKLAREREQLRIGGSTGPADRLKKRWDTWTTTRSRRRLVNG